MRPQEAFDALGETYVEMSDGGNTYLIRGEGARDMRDGASLRRLREALAARVGERWRCTVLLSEPDDTQGRVWVTASRRNEFDGLDIIPEHDKGSATVADAADKCREALGA